MVLEIAGWLTAIRSAALAKLRWRATSRKHARWRNLMRLSMFMGASLWDAGPGHSLKHNQKHQFPHRCGAFAGRACWRRMDSKPGRRSVPGGIPTRERGNDGAVVRPQDRGGRPVLAREFISSDEDGGRSSTGAPTGHDSANTRVAQGRRGEVGLHGELLVPQHRVLGLVDQATDEVA